jgi:hypothetical protein
LLLLLSLGGYTALYAASSPETIGKKLINGCILLNAAGRFRSQDAGKSEEPTPKVNFHRIIYIMHYTIFLIIFICIALV